MHRISFITAVTAIGVAAITLMANERSRAAEPGVHGFGYLKCSYYLRTRTGAAVIDRVMDGNLKEWVLGFATGAEIQAAPPAGAKPDGDEAIIDWVDTYCREHPDELLVAAGKALVMQRSGAH